MSRVVWLASPTWFPGWAARATPVMAEAAQCRGITLVPDDVEGPGALESVFTAARVMDAQALTVPWNPLCIAERQRIVDSVAKSRSPAIDGDELFVSSCGQLR